MKQKAVEATGPDRILLVTDHRTPYTDQPAARSPEVRLKKVVYRPGKYPMENVQGYEYFRLAQKTLVTVLQLKTPTSWQTWMVDDPLHWHGMGELARLCLPGRVLVAELGLGLILHKLAARPDVTEIVVLERDEKVLEFMRKYVPDDFPRTQFLCRDMWDYLGASAGASASASPGLFSTAILDIWVLDYDDDLAKRREVRLQMAMARVLASAFAEKVLIWGVRGY